MLVKFFRNSGRSPITQMYNYLLGENNDREHVRLLVGDVQLSKDIIHQMNFSNKYTAGCLSFQEQNIPEPQKYELMQDFEKSLLNGLQADQYNITWIEHRDKGRLELNFVIANQELTTQKRLQPYFDKVDRPLVENWKIVKNAEYGFSDPKDPEKLQAVSDHKNLGKQVKSERDIACDFVQQAFEQGAVKSRKDVLEVLSNKGYEIERESKKSISIKNPSAPEGRNIRLTGELFHHDFSGVLSAENKEEQEKYAENGNNRLEEARQKLDYALNVKCTNNQEKYGVQPVPQVDHLLDDYDYDYQDRTYLTIDYDDAELEKFTEQVDQYQYRFRETERTIKDTDRTIAESERTIADTKHAIVESERAVERIPELHRMRADRVDEVYQEFINQQNHYANFANEFYGLVNQVNQRFQELDKDLVKSEKWLSKQQGFYLRNGLFYDNYHHNRVDVDVPPYFVTEIGVDKSKNDLLQQQGVDVARLSDKYDIENTVKQMRTNADFLTENDIELPIPKPTFMQRMKGEYIHSFNTLSDFDNDVSPLMSQYRQNQSEQARQKLKEYRDDLQRQENAREAEKERDRLKAEYDLEVQRRIAQRHEREGKWANEPKPEQTKDQNNDNDFTM